ncbi:uncharacterized protein DUF1232 [Desulfobotulus alkaliphilus]|uniref:Uncharacterized protein DUF1232 n=1 Tax=Desulfobotulus alkaliphilus TaxID=622671 RepID=A0A562RW35_9BACT|nr:DUF1232 domain-containing protein [Desulfobotulus alkaliphilus]TWI73198.1 uncharacterized protein DUF1232 [Desulfobotulus alkaliphilus]
MTEWEDNKNEDFYRKLRVKIKDWAVSEAGRNNRWSEYILLAPDLFYLLCKLVVDPEVPAREKAKLAFAIAYFISPIDLLPEAILGPAGYLDDIVLATYALNSVMTRTPAHVLEKHWVGEEDLFETVRRVLDVADEMIGAGLIRKIRAMLGGK